QSVPAKPSARPSTNASALSRRPGLHPAVPHPGATLDRRHVELVEVEAIAQHLQEAQLFLLDMEVSGSYFDRHRVSGLIKSRLERVGDQVEDFVDPVLMVEVGRAGVRHAPQVVLAKAAEYRQS